MGVADAPVQSVADNLGLLVDFLEHEVAVLALFDFGNLAGDVGDFTLNALVCVPDLHFFQGEFGDIAFFQIHEAVCDLPECQRVRRDEILTNADADDERAATARHHDLVGLAGADHTKTIRAVQFLDCLLHCVKQGKSLGGARLVNQMHHCLGVGLGGEHIALGDQVLPQCLIVFDDAIVHERNAARRQVGMRIAFAGFAVGSPARMRDADAPLEGPLRHGLIQLGHFAGGLDAVDVVGPGIQQRHPGRIIAAIFQPSQTFQQNSRHVTLRNRANYSTHLLLL